MAHRICDGYAAAEGRGAIPSVVGVGSFVMNIYFINSDLAAIRIFDCYRKSKATKR